MAPALPGSLLDPSPITARVGRARVVARVEAIVAGAVARRVASLSRVEAIVAGVVARGAPILSRVVAVVVATLARVDA